MSFIASHGRAATVAILLVAGISLENRLALGTAGAAALRRSERSTAPATAESDRATGAVTRRAHAASTIEGSDTARLHLVRQHESVLDEEGVATGVLAGRMRADLKVGSLFTGDCTIETSRGSITGHGSASPHGVGRYQSFRGTLVVTSGTGRYKGIHGTTQLYGTFDRRTFDLVIHTAGRLSY